MSSVSRAEQEFNLEMSFGGSKEFPGWERRAKGIHCEQRNCQEQWGVGKEVYLGLVNLRFDQCRSVLL